MTRGGDVGRSVPEEAEHGTSGTEILQKTNNFLLGRLERYSVKLKIAAAEPFTERIRQNVWNPVVVWRTLQKKHKL